MISFYALLRKQTVEARWVLGLTALALFGFGWLFVFVTSRTESEIRQALAGKRDFPRMRLLRSMGVVDQMPVTVSILMASWHSPGILLAVSVWAIGRGSVAVAGEIERGTLDLMLSRPISRTTYLAAQVAFATAGLLALAAALIAGSLAATRYNPLREPLSALVLAKPALNLALMGFAIYGYTLLFSALDSARWRPNLIASTLTLGGFIAWVVALLPVMAESQWRPILEKVSVFQAFNPVDAVTKAEVLGTHLGVLALVGVLGVVASWGAFVVRDLPANS